MEINSGNPYDILGIDHSATDEEIKSAYKYLVKRNHPDKNKKDLLATKKFQLIQWAYDSLTKKNDTEFASYQEMRNFKERAGVRPDVTISAEISFKDFFEGRYLIVERNGIKINVFVPQYTFPGTKLKISGQGNETLNGHRGDLYVIINIKNAKSEEGFRFQDKKLFYDVYLNQFELLVGKTIRFPEILPIKNRACTIPPLLKAKALKISSAPFEFYIQINLRPVKETVDVYNEIKDFFKDRGLI